MSAAEEYRKRIRERAATVERHEASHIRLGNLRLLLGAIAAVLIWEVFRQHALSPWWIVAPVAVFVVVAAYHARVLRERELAQRAVAFYERGLARVEDRWQGIGESGERFAEPHHVYSSDLDLFGPGSLFELISTARTRMGEETLAAWLLAPAAVTEITKRHAAVRELRDQLDFRENLAVLGADAAVGVHPEQLARWAESPDQMKPESLRWLSLTLAAMAVGGVVVWGVLGLVTPFILIVAFEAAIKYRLRKALDEVLYGSESAFRDLGLLAAVLDCVERQNFNSPRLKTLQATLFSNGITSSAAVARLKTIVELSDSRENWFLRVLDVPLMYSIQVAFMAERWRREHGRAVSSWLQTIGEIEALLSLAGYSYEHASDPFPEFVSAAACFEAKALGHPLIPAAKCVLNDVSIHGATRSLLVSGSNMSGKSTLLRTVGINVVLAMAGAPVRAQSLRLTPLHVGASIRINDSLHEGSSRFYAEIKRLRQLLDVAGAQPPLLFLLDELLQGTNSSDRRVGAEGVLIALLKRGSIGLVSTHDLALAEMDGNLQGQLHNVHFQEEFSNGRMLFDYRLRDGVVTKSNGLELMRSIGLDV